MGLLTRLFERRVHPSSNIDWQGLFGAGTTSYAGANVTEESALTLSAYFACVRVLAESLAGLPLLTYQRRADGGKDRAPNHPLYKLLKEQSNPEMTAFEFRETITGHTAGGGNGYAEIEWSNSGRPLALWPLNPRKMGVIRKNRELRYLYTPPDGKDVNFPAWRIHHLRGLSGNGIVGYSMARLAMQSVGLGLGTEEFGALFFGNGARPGVLLKHPGALSDTAYERLKKSWNADHQGLSNAHRVKILEEGLDVATVGVPPEEAQFLETRKFQVSEIARWFRMPPHMIQDLDKATFSNIEHQSIDFVVHTLRPWLVRSEQALTRDLLTEEEQEKFFIEYLVDGLLRGDIKSRYDAYSIGRQNGWLSANDIRTLENMNPVAGGDVYLLPLNMAPAGAMQQRLVGRIDRRGWIHDPECRCAACGAAEGRADDDDDSADGESDEVKTLRQSKQKLARDFIPLYAEVAGRVVRREVADIKRAINKQLRKRSLDDFRQWLSEFYGEFVNVLSDAFLAMMQTYAAQVATATADELDEEDSGVTDELKEFIDAYLEAFATGYVASSSNQIDALITDALAEDQDVADVIEERLDEWEETRPDKIARGQAFEAGNALAVALYVGYNVRRLRWAASGASCPFCQRLSGNVIGIEGYFVNKGDSVNGGPDDTPMLVRRNTRHGPLHGGCDCVVVAD